MMFGGSVLAAVKQMGHGYEAFAQDKTDTLLENANKASSVKFAGRKVFFFGDNGQGDMLAALSAIETNAIHFGMIRIGKLMKISWKIPHTHRSNLRLWSKASQFNLSQTMRCVKLL